MRAANGVSSLSALNVSVTVDLTLGTVTSAINGMDGEVRGTSNWLYFFLISDGLNTAGLCSVSSGGGLTPTLPTGYFYSLYVGAMRVDGAGNLLRTLQVGDTTQYTVIGGTNTANYPIPFAAGVGAPGTPTFVSVASSSIAPPTAIAIDLHGVMTAAGGAFIFSPNNATGSDVSITNPSFGVGLSGTAGVGSADGGMMNLESANVFGATNAAAVIVIRRWRDGNINA